MKWIFYVQLGLAAICWFYMGKYVYLRIKEIYGKRKV